MVEFNRDEIARLQATQQPKNWTEVLNMLGVIPKNQPFLWWPYLPLGRLVIVAGAPGHGKSQLSALIAAMATRGSLYPGNVTEPSRVLMLCAEDDLATTVVPRLLAVNADLGLVDTINRVAQYPSGLKVRSTLRIPTDVDVIHEWVKTHVDARLVVLDPVASFFDASHSMLVNQDSRDALGPLITIAEDYGVTIVIVMHLNKSESKDFANRIAESHGFQALARSVIALAPDPDDPERERGSKKILALTKANLVKSGAYSMRCELRSVTLPSFDEPISTSELALTGKCDISADDLLLTVGERTARLEAGGWLREFFGDGGWRKVADVRKAAESDGLAWRSIDRTARSQGYERMKAQGVEHGKWFMAPPNSPPMPPPNQGRDGRLGELEPGQGDQGANGTTFQGDQGDPGRVGEMGAPWSGDLDLDAYREWERKRLGERDDDE